MMEAPLRDAEVLAKTIGGLSILQAFLDKKNSGPDFIEGVAEAKDILAKAGKVASDKADAQKLRDEAQTLKDDAIAIKAQNKKDGDEVLERENTISEKEAAAERIRKAGQTAKDKYDGIMQQATDTLTAAEEKLAEANELKTQYQGLVTEYKGKLKAASQLADNEEK